MRIFFAVFAALFPLLLSGQALNNGSLNGRYGFVHFWVDVNDSGFADNARNLGGVATFDGNGRYTFQGQLGDGAAAATASSGGGAYSVASNGFLTLESPIDGAVTVNARVGDQADVLLGSSTEGPGGVYDLFIAVRLPNGGPGNGLLSGNYSGASLWLPGGSDLAIKTSLVDLTPNGQGAFTALTTDGHAADQGDTPLQQSIAGSTYTVAADGTGSLSLGSGSTLFQGAKTIYVSQTGNYVVGHSTAAGGRDVFVALRSVGSGATNASLANGYWMVDLFADRSENRYNAAVGSLNSNGAGVVSIAQRLKVDGLLDFSGINSYGLSSDGTGFLRGVVAPNLNNFAIGAPGSRPAVTEEGAEQAASANGFVGAEVFQTRAFYEVHGITVGVRLPQLSGSGVFLSPLGVVNAASYAPPTHPISGGSMTTLFGTGLADAVAKPESVPLPTQFGGVSVTIDGIPAPLFFVSPNQINLQTPFAVQGPTAEIVVTKNGQTSNTVEVPVAATSPGVFSVQQSGFGPGIITHADYSLVTDLNPARLGEVVILFLTGLGAVDPPFADGTAGPLDPLSFTTDPNIAVLFDGVAGDVQFSGAAPNFVGLYQLNVQIPTTGFTGTSAVAIQTSNAFSDFVDIEVIQ
jgi:uncharacterized protein (TIGR03437 family)